MSITLDFGNFKTSTFKEWTGKERRLLQKLIETDSFTQENISKILVHDCQLDEPKYYTDDEINYISMMLYKNSFEDTINIEYNCEKCNKNNVINTGIDNILNIKISSISFFETNNIRIEFGKPNYSNYIDIFNKLDSNVDKLFLNFLLCIDKIFIDDKEIAMTDKIRDAENILENISIKDFDAIIEYFYDNSFSFTPKIKNKCSCGHEEEVYCSYLPKLI